MSILQKKYNEVIKLELKKTLALKNIMQVPVVEKVVLGICVSQAIKTPKILVNVSRDLSLIAGQKAIITKAKKAISNFKLRQGMPLGSCVTLRRDKMWTFLERLIHFSLPQVRDFRGLSPKSFDGNGNYSMGIKEQIIFPEIDYDKVDAIRGMNITICTSAKTDAHARSLLEFLGLPFKK